MNSEKLLKNAGYKVFSRKMIDKVTITDIIREAELSKQTFYRYYTDKYELANAIFDDLFIKDYYCAEDIVKNSNWEQMYKEQFDSFANHHSFVRSVYSSRELIGTAEYDAQKCIELDKEIVRLQGGDIKDPLILFAIEVKDRGGIDYLRRWLMNDMPISSTEMAHRFYQILPNILMKYYKKVAKVEVLEINALK